MKSALANKERSLAPVAIQPKERVTYLDLPLTITDPEIRQVLERHPEGRQRHDYAVGALRLGILALRQADGEVDTASIREEGSRLLEKFNTVFSDGQDDMADKLAEGISQLRGEFSLDNEEGVLLRLLGQFEAQNGQVSDSVSELIEGLVSEFSLDRDDSALSHLVRRVEKAQKEIGNTFSLDDENSALTRLKRELLEVIEQSSTDNDEFRSEIRSAIAGLNARRQESRRSTRHGDDFEAEVFEFVRTESERAGDCASRVGTTAGAISRCKKGDIIVDLSPEHVAAGARVVVEAKADASVTISNALAELEQARENREAEVGLFVFSRRVTAEETAPFVRYGNDIVVVWDEEDPASDVYLTAGLSVAKALCAAVSEEETAEESEVDLEAVSESIDEIEGQIKCLDSIRRAATTIRSNSNKILNQADVAHEAIEKETAFLATAIDGLRASSSVEDSE